MAPKQRMRIANEKASKNVTQRGNVPKTTVSNWGSQAQKVVHIVQDKYIDSIILSELIDMFAEGIRFRVVWGYREFIIMLSSEVAYRNVQQQLAAMSKLEKDGYPVGPWLLALFIFVVCGSAVFQIIQSIRMA